MSSFGFKDNDGSVNRWFQSATLLSGQEQPEPKPSNSDDSSSSSSEEEDDQKLDLSSATK